MISRSKTAAKKRTSYPKLVIKRLKMENELIVADSSAATTTTTDEPPSVSRQIEDSITNINNNNTASTAVDQFTVKIFFDNYKQPPRLIHADVYCLTPDDTMLLAVGFSCDDLQAIVTLHNTREGQSLVLLAMEMLQLLQHTNEISTLFNETRVSTTIINTSMHVRAMRDSSSEGILIQRYTNNFAMSAGQWEYLLWIQYALQYSVNMFNDAEKMISLYYVDYSRELIKKNVRFLALTDFIHPRVLIPSFFNVKKIFADFALIHARDIIQKK